VTSRGSARDDAGAHFRPARGPRNASPSRLRPSPRRRGGPDGGARSRDPCCARRRESVCGTRHLAGPGSARPTLMRATTGNDERDTKLAEKPTLLERLSAFLTREPEDREELLHLLHGSFERKLLDADALSIIEGALPVSEWTGPDL